MSSHGLLLRLFLSQGFFSVLHALQYIRTYSDNIGITHYLCSRLDAVPTDELADKWPLIWCVDASLFCSPVLIVTGSHLLVISPSSKSSALESFVLAKAQQSTHLALMVRLSTSMVWCQHTDQFDVDPLVASVFSARSIEHPPQYTKLHHVSTRAQSCHSNHLR